MLYQTHLYSRRSKKLFEKNAGPVMYLAGIEVNVVKVSTVKRLDMIHFSVRRRAQYSWPLSTTKINVFKYR